MKEEITETIGQRIARLRDNELQLDFGDYFKISRPTISN